MKIPSHSESHIVELEDGSQWRIFPGDIGESWPEREVKSILKDG
jgi:hypothetical protein